jgi:hypothetical protein
VNVETAAVCTGDRAQAVSSVLLGKLASDDEFRSRLESNPREVFAEYRLETPYDMPVTLKLPAKEEVHALVATALERQEFEPDPGWLFCWFV